MYVCMWIHHIYITCENVWVQTSKQSSVAVEISSLSSLLSSTLTSTCASLMAVHHRQCLRDLFLYFQRKLKLLIIKLKQET